MKKIVWILLGLTLVFFCPVLVDAQTEGDESEPAIAYDTANDLYLSVYSRYTTGVTQIWGQVVNAAGQKVNAPFIIYHHPTMNSNPTLAYDSINGVFFVVWEHYALPDADIYGKYVKLNSDGSVSIRSDQYNYDFQVNCDDLGNKSFPTIAYDSAGHNFLVVWDDDRYFGASGVDLYSQTVPGYDFSGGGPLPVRCFGILGVDKDKIVSNAAGDQRISAIANDSVNGRFMVAWLDTRAGKLTPGVYGRILDSNGTPVSPTDIAIALPGGPLQRLHGIPTVAFNNTNKRFMVVFPTQEFAGLIRYVINGRLFDANGAVLAGLDIDIMGPNPKEAPVVVDASSPYPGGLERWLVSWQETVGAAESIYYILYEDNVTTIDGVFSGSLPVGKALSLAYNPNHLDFVVAFEVPPAPISSPLPTLVAYSNIFHDGDYDGVSDADDNCPSVYNPDQADENENGVGDVCDVPSRPTLVSPTDGLIGTPTNPTMSWNVSIGANSYALEVSADSGFGSPVVAQDGIADPFYAMASGMLSNNGTYYWRVKSKSGLGDSLWSEVWNFRTEPVYGNLFINARGITDPDVDGDGLDDEILEGPNGLFGNGVVGTDPTKKTLFVRPLHETGYDVAFKMQYEYWPGFIQLFPESRPGFAKIQPFANAGIEIVVVGAPDNIYTPMKDWNYDPATDPKHPNVDILTIIYKLPNAYVLFGSSAKGHTFFYTNGSTSTWSWDTKGYTPSTPGAYGYKTPEIYPFPLDKYFQEGAYGTIAVGATPPPSKSCDPGPCTGKSTMNINSLDPINGAPDDWVEFNPIAFNSDGSIKNIPTPLPATPGCTEDEVRARTIAHELGHALLEGLNSDHCADPQCIMYEGVKDWNLYDFGHGNCIHIAGGSKDIRAFGIVHNGRQTSMPPVLVSPNDKATGVSRTPKLSWNASAGATSYRLQVSKGSTVVLNQSSIPGTSCTLTSAQALTRNTTYSWKVKSVNAVGESASWSNVWTFTTVR
jgi:hypothetical protein